MKSSRMKLLLREFINEFINESDDKKKLRVVDFDDTLVKTDALIHVTDEKGEDFDLSPAEFATYVPEPGDVFDYSDFEELINPQHVKWMVRIISDVYRKYGPEGFVILSARSSSKPIIQFLNDLGLSGVYVVALGNADPKMKADWIDARIKRDKLDLVEFFDDSRKNIEAVKGIQKDHPKTKIIVHHIAHDKKM
jgi:hypothetical protein